MEKHYAFSALFFTLTLCMPPTQAQWDQVGPGGNAFGVVTHNGALVASLQNNGVRRSLDHGDTWTDVNTGITEPSNWWLASEQGVLFCGTQFGAAFRSTDDGATWEAIDLSAARGFATHNDTIYACQWYGSVVKFSADGGSTWTNTATMSGTNNLWPLIAAGGSLFVGGQTGGVQRYNSSADTWTASSAGLQSQEVYAFMYVDDILFAGTGNTNGHGGVYRSDDLGASWTASGVSGQTVYALHAYDGMLLAGTANGGVFMSTDAGNTWTAFNDGLNSNTVVRLTDDGSYLYAGTLGGGVYRYDVASSVGEQAMTGTRVHAYPVPCDHDLTTEVDLDAGARIQLHLLDIAGRMVAEQVAGMRSAGAHRFTWDMTDLAPGTYTCVVTAGDERHVMRVVRE